MEDRGAEIPRDTEFQMIRGEELMGLAVSEKSVQTAVRRRFLPVKGT